MVTCHLYENPIGDVSEIWIDHVTCDVSSLMKVIDVFNLKYILVKIMALDRGDPFYKLLSDEAFSISFPKTDTVLSETIITSKSEDFISVYNSLVQREPRCISLYEISEPVISNIELFGFSDEMLIKRGVVHQAVSLIVEEMCIKISFDKRTYCPKQLTKELKKRFC